MDAYESLVESLPAGSGSVQPRRGGGKAIAEAVAGLPMANPARAARAVEGILEDMLAARWSGSERIAALEHLRAAVATLSAGVQRRLGAAPYPLPRTLSEAAATTQRLHGKLAQAYALGLYELCTPGGKLPWLKARPAATAAVLGLTHIAHIVLWGCRQYQAIPPGMWRRAHALYAFADGLGIAGYAVPDGVANGAVCSARDAYARLLLITLSNPNRFSARELEQAWQVCRSTAALCGFTWSGGETGGADAGVSVDARPGTAPDEHLALGSAGPRVDVAPIEGMFDERVALLPTGADALDLPEPGGGRFTTSVRLLDRLRAGWSYVPRKFPRLEAHHALDVVVGMHALHYSLAGDIDFGTFVRRVQDDAITVEKHHLPAAWRATSDTVQPPVFRAEVLEQGPGGYRLRLAVREGLRMRIGEVIGLAPVVEGAQVRDWMVGVIRWLRHEEAGVLSGIELLRREASAASVCAGVTDGDALAPQRAVELRGGEGRNGLALLVSHPFLGTAGAMEVMLPAIASDWCSRAVVARFRPGGVEALGEACFRVTLMRSGNSGDG